MANKPFFTFDFCSAQSGRYFPIHQQKSIRLAPSGTSGTSGVSGRFSCQKCSSFHFFSELLYNHNYIINIQNFQFVRPSILSPRFCDFQRFIDM